jgi:hypothetical protein
MSLQLLSQIWEVIALKVSAQRFEKLTLSLVNSSKF